MKQELAHMKSVDRPAANKPLQKHVKKVTWKKCKNTTRAKEAQGMLEAKIKYLEGVIATARILDESNIDTSKVDILTKVTLTNLATKKKVTYQIVSEKSRSKAVRFCNITHWQRAAW